MSALSGLNPEQRKAVEYTDGPVLIFAGAGSGKTKVLTHKIAYLIEQKVVPPGNILAVTFTNKAAQELRSRVVDFVGLAGSAVQVGTFHSICARILRREIPVLGFTRQFTIYDEEDQRNLLKKIISDRSIVIEGITPKSLLSKISLLKNKMVEPTDFRARPGSYFEKQVEYLYPLYQAALQAANAVDFDDLLIFPLRIFSQYPEVLRKYQAQYRYVLIDEYQDTNRPQFLFVEMLGHKHQNVCVVGDDDQSIYSWRGADIENILRFDSVFQKCAVFKLEQNYRSTNTILKAASAVVANNLQRAQKQLWSQKEDGEAITRIDSDNEYDEANRIVSSIQHEIRQHKRKFKDFTILYRTNAQTRVLEEVLRRNSIVYTIVGGVRFYERKEVKDLLAYLHLLSNPKDDINLKRIINLPPRGIGKTTLKRLEEFALERKVSIFEALSYLDFLELSKRALRVLENFRDLIGRIQQLREALSLDEWSRVVVDEIEIRPYYKEKGGEEARQRLANIDEFLNDISDFCSKTETPDLETYLANVSLSTSIDTWEDEKNAVSLMTLHSAKGLEFPVVMICGINQGLLPLMRDTTDQALEEERRLFYVGLTRAREKVYLSWSQTRSVAGETQYSTPSMFLGEIPDELVQQSDVLEGVVSYRRSRQHRRPAVQKATSEKPETGSTVSLQAGKSVAHKIFGIGVILEVNGSGQNARLKIRFRTEGIKTIIAKYVRPV